MMSNSDHSSELAFGIRKNLHQFSHQLIQVFLVGLTLGTMRTVIPALAEDEFGVAKDSFLLLTAFVVAFGIVKGIMNFVAGRLSEKIGRKKVLLAGWLVAIPIPFMIYFAPGWNWIVLATILLGINQGMAWSMTQTAKLDFSHPEQRGLVIGFNEFAGYIGVATAGIITGYLASALGARSGLLVFGLASILLALFLTWLWIEETLHWVTTQKPASSNAPSSISTWQIFRLVSWQDKRFFAVCQAGLVEKFVDALVWIFYPAWLYQNGVSLANIGWIVAVYGFVWGGSQFITGKLSDHFGRRWPNILGMWICGAGVLMTLASDQAGWWVFSAAVTGFGMALLYPNLSAAIADMAEPQWRGTAIGIYRFWRDLGYGIGALLLGISAQMQAMLEAGFVLTGIAMLLSGGILFIWGKESHPALSQDA